MTQSAAASEPIRRLGDGERAARRLANRLLDADREKIRGGAAIGHLGYVSQKDPPREFAAMWVREIGPNHVEAFASDVAELLKATPPPT